MQAAASSISWSGETDNLRSRFPLVGLIETLLGPVLAVVTLIISVLAHEGSFDRHYFALSLLTFLLLFPGILRISESRWRMALKASLAWLVLCATLYFIGYVTDYLDFYDRDIILTWQLATLAALLASHEIARQSLLRVLAHDPSRVVIVGANDTGVELAAHFEQDRYAGSRFLGFFDDRPRERMGHHIGDRPVLGAIDNLASYVKTNAVNQIYIALPMASQPRILALLQSLRDTTASVYFVPDLFVTELIQGRVEHVSGMPAVAVCESPFTGVNGIIKRAEDLVLGSLIVLLISPLLLGVALAVKFTSPGPVIFAQRRYGLDGKEVIVYKFRSMTVTEDGDKAYTQVSKGDARVTKVGAFIRKTSLDELPQFINVLQGRMSIVGPRPHAVAVNEKYRTVISGYMVRHKVRPGITGWAQVNGYRGGDDLEHMSKRIYYDLQYLRNWSLSLDLRIILRTVGLVAKDSAAY
ncbi:undecaprenyl-phosphate glucose phosphotransferase [Uliginosibacterium sp. 31-12]|uniref:undecaprenyl-phosphate glucose phosphotransferase n=1 Tax=Uliginosibacterium sp. 31-12 TaxID=3062781 RepID=UPI0026E1B033|nr:undecaprenyl-phosphate glucose phosphotransferase [Uliginosibacterium sp. 31-12]MDO6387294.1 undecaprenyl-phosphate glucose phosphotransferase [Uliginosibacterium sp. 31-12]